MTRRVLVTGFGSFGSVEHNPTTEVVDSCGPLREAGLDVVAEVLPVEFDAGARRIRELVGSLRPDLAICFGVAEGRDAVTPERIAINVADARIPDNTGFQPVDSPLEPDGPAARFSTLPLRGMVRALTDAGVRAEVSNTAGTYVCNAVFFSLMGALEVTGGRGGFVHVPPDADMAALVPLLVHASETFGHETEPFSGS